MSTEWEIFTDKDPLGGDLVKVTVTNKTDRGSSYSFSVHIVNGESYEFFCSESRWASLNDRMKYKKGDVVIVASAKCGTTWVEQIVLLLLNHGQVDLMNPAVKNAYDQRINPTGKVWVEGCVEQDPSVQKIIGPQAAPITFDEFDSIAAPRVMKTHATPPFMLGTERKGLGGLPDGVKVIVVSRNPFDACVSSYYYGLKPQQNGWPFDAWAAAWLSGLAPQGDWFQWVRLWRQQVCAHPDSALWVHYEDLQRAPREQITRIAQFLGVIDTHCGDVSIAAEQDAFLERVLEHSSFASMKARADSAQAANPTAHRDEHLRKGRSGGWDAYFNTSGSMFKAFIEKFHRELDGTGLVFGLGEGHEELRATD